MAEEHLVTQEKEEETEVTMAKQTQLLGKLYTLPHYREGDFLVSAPEDLLSLDLKKGKHDVVPSGLTWDPWPKEDGVVRLGRFFLRRDTKFSWHDKWKGKRVYARMIAEVDENGQPGEWMRFRWRSPGNAATRKLKCYHGERCWGVLEARAMKLTDTVEQVRAEIEEEIRRWVIAENFKSGDNSHHAGERSFLLDNDRVAKRVLKTPEGEALKAEFAKTATGPYNITEADIRAILGPKKGSLGYSANTYLGEFDFWEFEYREKYLQLEAEWARKQLMKVQQKLRREQKKKMMAERNLDEEALAAEKEERRLAERRVKRTTEWVKVSKDVHNSLDWLQEFVRRMGNFEKIDQKWFDKNRRELRALATKMKPLSRVLND